MLYPTDAVVRTAIRGAATYRLPWFDAQLWAYAECFQCRELFSEDFQHGRMYGTVKAVNPFAGADLRHEPFDHLGRHLDDSR